MRKALVEAGRGDLIGAGCDALIPETPPADAIRRRREDANARFQGEYVHTVPTDRRKRSKKESRNRPGPGYRPGRKSTR